MLRMPKSGLVRPLEILKTLDFYFTPAWKRVEKSWNFKKVTTKIPGKLFLCGADSYV
jgi:hypothetical protein